MILLKWCFSQNAMILRFYKNIWFLVSIKVSIFGFYSYCSKRTTILCDVLLTSSHRSALSSVVYNRRVLGSTLSAVQFAVTVVIRSDCTDTLVTLPAKLPM